jgi:hypothetical protein
MRINRWYVGCAVVSALILSGLATAPAIAAPPPYDVFVNGDATPYAYNGVIDGTTVSIPVLVRCPVGQVVYVPFAGMPGYFSDGRFAQPYLPSMTGPNSYGGQASCTGQLQSVTTLARTVSRNQDPSFQPFDYFTSGPLTVMVELQGSGTPPVTDTKSINVLPPPGTGIVIHTDSAILQLEAGDPVSRTNIGVSFSYTCSPPFGGRLGRVSPVVSRANPTWAITCDDTWHTLTAGSGIAATVGTVDFSVDLAGRVERKTITVTPPLPDAVASMSLSNSTPHTMDVAWSAPPPRVSALGGAFPDTSITGYKVGWIEANTGRGWETTSPHWPLSYSPVTLTGLIPNTTYTVWVTPVNASGDGLPSVSSYSTTLDIASPPTVPPATAPVVGTPPAIIGPPIAPLATPIFATQTATTSTAVVPQPVLSNVAVLPSVITRIPSRISIVATKRVRRGRLAGLSGVVTTYRGGRFVRASGLRVVLQRLAGKKWVNVALSTSKGASARRLHGSVNLNLRPARTTTYRWVFAGNKTVAPSVSKTVTVVVLR